MTHLIINMNGTTLEVEGEETFVKSVYQDFKDRLVKAPVVASAPAASAQSTPTAPAKAPIDRAPKSPTRKKPRESFTIVKDLDLSGKTNSQSLRDFYSSKSPATAMEKNVVFVYYLQQIVGVSPVTLNHLYSCYKDVSVPVPTALRQSVADTSSRRGWLDTQSFDNIRLATPGENYVEHDLPKPAAR